MRRIAALVGLAAAAAGAAVWAARSAGARQSREAMSHGAAPGRLGSWMNSLMDGPTYRAFAQVLDVHPEDELLDVACGWGEFLVNHAAGARRVSGVDLAPAKVALPGQPAVFTVA
jgi:2-polyprenyl-3-methyl-5-hydroxy-6-metoxy-1,4-benzoquinol methylase